MIRTITTKYMPDVIAIVLIAILAILAAGRPGADMPPRPREVSSAAPQQAAFALRESKVEEKDTAGIAAVPASADALKERNIFSADGSYATPSHEAGRVLSADPYVLIGLLDGKERKAVFRDDQGVVAAYGIGKKMTDGFVIARLEASSVKLTRGKETKELRIFDVKYTPPRR